MEIVEDNAGTLISDCHSHELADAWAFFFLFHLLAQSKTRDIYVYMCGCTCVHTLLCSRVCVRVCLSARRAHQSSRRSRRGSSKPAAALQRQVCENIGRRCTRLSQPSNPLRH